MVPSILPLALDREAEAFILGNGALPAEAQ
jgi:hypothetical protein